MFQNSQNPFTCGPSFGPFWSVKYLNFGQNLPIWTAHPTFLESEHPEVTKSLYYVLFLKGSQKSISSWTISYMWSFNYMWYKFICMWSLFFSVRVYESLHFLPIILENYVFFFPCFGFDVSLSLAFSFYPFVLYFEFNVILNNIRLNNILQFSSHFSQMIC